MLKMKPTLDTYARALEWLADEKKYLIEVDENLAGIPVAVKTQFREAGFWKRLGGSAEVPTDEFLFDFETTLDEILLSTAKRRKSATRDVIELMDYLDVPSREYIEETSLGRLGLDDEIRSIKSIKDKELSEISVHVEKVKPIVGRTIGWVTGLEGLLKKSRDLLYSCPELFSGNVYEVDRAIAQFSIERKVQYLTTVSSALTALPAGTKDILKKLIVKYARGDVNECAIVLTGWEEYKLLGDVLSRYGNRKEAAKVYCKVEEWKLAGDVLLKNMPEISRGRRHDTKHEKWMRTFREIERIYTNGELWEDIVQIHEKRVKMARERYVQYERDLDHTIIALDELAQTYVKIGEEEKAKKSWLETARIVLKKKWNQKNKGRSLNDHWKASSKYLLKALPSEKEAWKYIAERLESTKMKIDAYERAGEYKLAAREEETYPRRDILKIASLYEKAGELELAADRFADGEKFLKAGELYEKLEILDKAARCYESGEDIVKAAVMYERGGDTETARLLRVKAVVAGVEVFPEHVPKTYEGALSLADDTTGALSYPEDSNVANVCEPSSEVPA
jgi:hypothetical protein